MGREAMSLYGESGEDEVRPVLRRHIWGTFVQKLLGGLEGEGKVGEGNKER
jgi:hypothetical protein